MSMWFGTLLTHLARDCECSLTKHNLIVIDLYRLEIGIIPCMDILLKNHEYKKDSDKVIWKLSSRYKSFVCQEGNAQFRRFPAERSEAIFVRSDDIRNSTSRFESGEEIFIALTKVVTKDNVCGIQQIRSCGGLICHHKKREFVWLVMDWNWGVHQPQCMI